MDGVFQGLWIKDASGRWAEHFRNYARDRPTVSVAALTNDPNIVLVLSNRGGDQDVIYEYEIAERQFGDTAFSHPIFNATGVRLPDSPETLGEVLCFTLCR